MSYKIRHETHREVDVILGAEIVHFDENGIGEMSMVARWAEVLTYPGYSKVEEESEKAPKTKAPEFVEDAEPEIKDSDDSLIVEAKAEEVKTKAKAKTKATK